MKISDIEKDKYKICGRTTESRYPLELVWTGSYIEFNVKAGEFRVLVEGPYDSYENWIAIEINGEIVSRRMVEKTREWITVFRMINPENITNVRIIKEGQAFSSDSEHRLSFLEVETDGELLPVNERKYKIEFIGDSITSAEGCAGAKQEMDWIASWFSYVNSYPYIVGKTMDADVYVFSQSGWGVYSSWDCNTEAVLPKYYEEICSLMGAEYFAKNGFHERWDFGKWQPDAIVINLGTNDDGAFHNDECMNSTLLRMIDDEYVEEDRIKVRDSITDFLKTVRKNNPTAHIIWALGVLGDKLIPTVKEAMENYCAETDDKNISFVKLPELTDETVGARCHPGPVAHKQMADTIVEELNKYI